jgi:hypothetical protein
MASQQAAPHLSSTSLRLAEALVSQGLTLAATQQRLTRLQALSPRERQAAERVLGVLLG